MMDTATLFAVAKQYGFPRVVVEYPNGKSRFHIAGTPAGWELALPYLERDGVLELAHHALCNPPSEPPPPEPLPELPEPFQNREPLVWNLLDEPFYCAVPTREREAIRILLAYAEALGYPELELPDYNYTIPNNQAGWMTAAKLMVGTTAVALATRMLHTMLYPQQQLPLTG